MARATAVVAGHELRAVWATPLPWIVGSLFNVVLGVLVVAQLEARDQAVFQPVVPIAGFLVLVAVPVLTMRTLADEARTGALDLLLVAPVAARSIVVGKWLALWFTALVVLAPVTVVAALLRWWGDPDWGPIVSGLVGLTVLAAAVAAIGVLSSAATSSQPVAAMTSLFALLVVWFAHVGSETTATGPLLASFSVSERLRTFAGGGVDTADIAFFAAAVAIALTSAAALVSARRARSVRPRSVGALVAALVLIVGAGVVVGRHGRLVDLTAEGTLTLTPETRDVVDRLREQPGRVRITAFVARDDPYRVSASALLSRYRRLDHRISFRILDPDDAPGEARRLGTAVLGAVAVVRGERVEHAAAPVEPDVTAALARLVRGVEPVACATRGHGEADVEDSLETGIAAFAAALRDNGYRVRPIDVLASPEVPPECDVALVASPRTPLGAAGEALDRRLRDGGRALVLADPEAPVDLTSLLAPWGLGVRRGIVLEGDPSARRPDDPTAPIVRRFSSGSPVVRNLPPVFMPGVQEVVVDDDPDTPGLTTSRLADTSARSYLETEPLRPDFDPAADRPGPVTVAAAADRSTLLPDGRVRRTRLVVVGDVDLATNAFLGDGANATFLVQAMDWLTLDEELVTVSPNLPTDRPLTLTPARLAYARALTAGVVPALFVLAGAAVWVHRRSR